jgi:Uncharacterised 5xTM membrane BCR, YitT family COG1284
VKVFFRKIASGLFLIVGVLSAGLGLKGFLLPSHFIDGGVTGVSMLISALSRVPLSVLILIINASSSATARSAVSLRSRARWRLAGWRCAWPFFPIR